MYVARPLSLYRRDPSAISLPPFEGPNSGYLVFTDKETEEQDTYFFGMCKSTKVRDFPFPQNLILNVTYRRGIGEHESVDRDKVLVIPALDQPLSSNRYYVIRAKGKYTGLACRCSTEEDMVTCCFSNCVSDVQPSLLDHRNIHQQVEICPLRRGFYAKSVAPDGFPPKFLRQKGWTVHMSSSFYCRLDEAPGLDLTLRMQLPDFNFPISSKRSSTVVVGKWYCPFAFIRDVKPLKDQMKNSTFYEMKLEQWWEEIYTCQNDNGKGNSVAMDVIVQKEVATVFGMESMKDEDTHGIDGFVWYKNVIGGSNFGLSLAITDKMKWIEELGGWVRGAETYERLERVEEFRGEKGWNRFGCCVLVERFALRRMDGTLVLTNEFRHTHQIRIKWE